jgi:magnesium chelatase family protein
MRQPLEDREVTISRAKFTNLSSVYAGGMNLSPSGFLTIRSPQTSSPHEMQIWVPGPN